MRLLGIAAIAAILGAPVGRGLQTPPYLASAQDDVDPSLRAAVERFFAAQEAEDIPRYLALWAASAERPQPAQLKFIFDSGDDKFSDLQIRRVKADGERTTVRVSVVRDRVLTNIRRPDGSSPTMHLPMQEELTYVREGGVWKLVREAPAGEALASALVAAASPADREALLASEPELVNTGLVSSVARHADAYVVGRQYAVAQRVYELAIDLAQRVGDKRAEGEAWQNVANALYLQRKLPEALAAYERRLALERDRNDDPGIAAATLGIATVLYSRFEYADALARYREALALFERLHDAPGIATTLISTGNVQYVQGDFAGALADYRRARDLYHQNADSRGEAGASQGLGRTLAAQGDLAGALNAYAFVLQEGRARYDDGLQANALKSIGEIHFRLGNLDIARSTLEQSRSHFEARADISNVGRVWQSIGQVDLVAARFAAAEQDYTTSITACDKGPGPLQDADCIAHGMVGVGFAQAAQQHYVAAIVSYRRGIIALMALKNAEDTARAEVGLSQALYGNKDYAGAATTAAHAAEQAAGLKRDDVLWRALVAQARANRRLSKPDRALESATSAVAAVERLASGFEELPVDRVPADTTDAFAMLAVLQAENGEAKAVFGTLERRRAHALRIALAANEGDIHRGMTEAERQEERRVTVDVMSVAAQIRNETGLPKPDSARIARLEQQLASAKAARTAARQKLFTRLPMLTVWRGLGGAADAAEALAPLGSPTPLFAEFVVSDEDLLVVLVAESPEGPLRTDAYLAHVESRTLSERITHALDPASLRDANAWHDAALDLVKLFPPAAWTAIAAAPRVIIAPDEVLWHMPFDALPVEGGVLGTRTLVRYVASATSLLPTPDNSSSSTAPLFAVASPELTAAAKDRMSATAPGWALRTDGAPETEARAVAAALGSPPDAVVAGPSATESAFRDRAPAASVLHIAAPFRVNSASPLFSPILLGGDADATAPERDGTLEARELFDLDLHARVAVFTDGAALSMRASVTTVDIVGWAWRAAGVPSIIVPRWTTDPAATTVLLEAFYKELKAGITVDEALQRARAAVRAREDMQAPIFWAGWMLMGPPERTEKTEKAEKY